MSNGFCSKMENPCLVGVVPDFLIGGSDQGFPIVGRPFRWVSFPNFLIGGSETWLSGSWTLTPFLQVAIS